MTRKIFAKLLEEATEVRGKRSEDRFGRQLGAGDIGEDNFEEDRRM
jgi:hypothetical protein